MSQPKISCLMPTYNKFPQHRALPEEALMAFLLQDYPNKELIILNDCPGQTLLADYPGVVVVNSPVRFRTLGEKLNAAAGLASGDYLCRWDDDDISLPNRLTYSLQKLTDSGFSYWKSTDYLYQNNGQIVYHNRIDVPVAGKALFTRELFDLVQGFRHINSGQDTDLEKRIRALSTPHYSRETVGRKEVYFIYRWMMGADHLSAVSARDPDKMKGYQKIGERKSTPGLYVLQPHFRHDYRAIAQRLKGETQALPVEDFPRVDWMP